MATNQPVLISKTLCAPCIHLCIIVCKVAEKYQLFFFGSPISDKLAVTEGQIDRFIRVNILNLFFLLYQII